MVRNITTLRQSLTRLISVAAVKGFRIFAHDVKQAYLQSEEELTRKQFLLQKKKDLKYFQLEENDIHHLLKPIYDTPDAVDYCGITMDRHAREDLQLEPTRGDSSLYIRSNDEDVDSVMGNYVDDGFFAGSEGMEELTEKMLKRFDSKPRARDNFEFFGTEIKILASSSFSIRQESYAKQLQLVPSDASLEYLHSLCASFVWVGHTGLTRLVL